LLATDSDKWLGVGGGGEGKGEEEDVAEKEGGKKGMDEYVLREIERVDRRCQLLATDSDKGLGVGGGGGGKGGGGGRGRGKERGLVNMCCERLSVLIIDDSCSLQRVTGN